MNAPMVEKTGWTVPVQNSWTAGARVPVIHSQAAAAASRTENKKVTKPESSSSPNRFPSKSPWARMFHTDWIPGSSVPEIQSHTAEIAGQ